MTVENGKSAFGCTSSQFSGSDGGDRAGTRATDVVYGPASTRSPAGDMEFSKDAHMAHDLVCLFLAIDDPEARERCLDFVREQALANDR